MRRGAVIVILMLLAASSWAQDATWLVRYDEQSTGVSPHSLDLPVSLAWKHTTGDEEATAVATPAVGPDMVYAPVGHSIYAIDRRTGALVWERSTGDNIYSSPALADGILYFGSRDGNLWAVDAEDGSVEWRYPTGGPVDCPPVVAYGICYFGSDDNRLVALDLETRQPIWQFETGGDIKAPPLVYRDVVIVGSLDRQIYALNAQGRPIWSNAVERKAFFASPVGERTKVVYASGRELVARDIYSGRLVWPRPFRAADLIVGSPCVQGRQIYIGTQGGAVYGIDANRGRALWRWPQEGSLDPINSSPVVVDDMIVFRAGTRELIAISLDGSTMLWKYVLPEPPEKGEKMPTRAGAEGAMGPVIPGEGAGMEPGEIPGGAGPGAAGPGGPAAGGEVPGAEGEGIGRGGEQEREITFENEVDPAAAVVGNALFTIGDDNVVYGFETLAPDNIAPIIAEPLLEVPGSKRTRVQFEPALADEDDFPDRYADEIEIPGTPPIYLSLKLTDEGSGVDPDSVAVTINGERADFSYDATEGLIWYMYAPRGAAANLSNGVKIVRFEASDWRGNSTVRIVSFTINNRLNPPEPPRRERQVPGGMGPGMPGEMGPGIPGEMFPGMPPEAGGPPAP
ncbi:MAG: PQQ-binding-like beta-propeller repeat protein [Armatimonadota bacterium]